MISPMMTHYLQTKEQYKDCILFYRLGDFYEFFFEDAILVSELLSLTLTGKDCGLSERAPMCGMPYHSAEGYINKLVLMGHKVAICEQLTAPKKGVKLVERAIVRIITAGTIIDENMVDQKRNNYIASICKTNSGIGMAFLDISTGEFKFSSFCGEDKLKNLNDALIRVMPSEILCNSDVDFEKNLPIVNQNFAPKFFKYADSSFEYNHAKNTLEMQLGEKSLQNYQDSTDKVGLCAAGSLIDYCKETQKRSLSHISNLQKNQDNNYMTIDLNTRKNLELIESIKDRKKKGTLLAILDKTSTTMGARKVRSMLEQPLFNEKAINDRLDGVEEVFSDIILRDSICDSLRNFSDIERISGRIAYGNFNPKDCLALAFSLEKIPQIKNLIANCDSNIIKQINNDLVDFSDVANELKRAIKDNPCTILSQGGYIRDAYSQKLDEYLSAQKNGADWILSLEQRERIETGIKNLKISYNKVFGYFIEVNKSQLGLVPLNYVRKQTVANNERFITEELKEMEEKILSSKDNAIKLEQELFTNIKNGLLAYISDIQKTGRAIAMLDTLCTFANIATKNNYVKPVVSSNIDCIEIVDGRHPCVEEIQKDFIPNDVYLNTTDNKTMIITGPNMAGKSTYMRQVALITLLAHIGCYVPAKSAKIALTDRIFTRVGASDDLAFGQSTFMVEMSELAYILKNASPNSLIILDEIGRGTSTFDGLSIAWATVEYLSHKLQAKTLFATHYHELTELEDILVGVKNYKINVKEINGEIVFLRKIIRGGANKSFGIEVASLAGVPKQITQRAKEISLTLEQNQNISKVETQSSSKDINAKNNAIILEKINGIVLETLSPLKAFEIIADLVNLNKGE